MEWLRKRLEEFRVKVRRLVQRNWHNDPEGDIFRSWDMLFILGAIRFKPTQKWQRICWNTVRVVTVCSFSMIVLNAMDEIPGKFDLVKATWHATVVLASTLCFVKDSILNQRFESIQTAQNFINSKPFGSGDTLHDSIRRKKGFQRLQLTALVFFIIVLMDHVVFMVPQSGIGEFFGTPRMLHYFEPSLAAGIHFVFLFTLNPIWLSKFFAGTGVICSLLFGFKTEYEIFVCGFENILDNVYLEVEENLPNTLNAAAEWKQYQRDQLYWKYLKQRVNDQVKLHIQLVENMQLLQPVVKDLFGITYYNAMLTFSPFIYVIWFRGFSAASLAFTSGVAFFLLECYGWCSIVDSFKDINEKLELRIMTLVTKIPHSQMHHEKHADVRTTLCIMKTFVRNHEPFSCGGVFPISVEAFTELLNIGYTVLTFLRDIGKKA